MSDLPPHPPEDRCFECATDSEIAKAYAGSGWHPTIHWQGVSCPSNPTPPQETP